MSGNHYLAGSELCAIEHPACGTLSFKAKPWLSMRYSFWQTEAKQHIERAETLFENSQLEESARQFETAIRIYEANNGGSDEGCLQCLTRLGAIHHALGDLGKATDIYSDLAVRSEIARGEGHFDTISIMFKLGKVCAENNNKDDAKAILGRARTLAQIHLPEDHYLQKKIRESFTELLEEQRWRQDLHSFTSLETIADNDKWRVVLKIAKKRLGQHQLASTTALLLFTLTCLATIVLINKMHPGVTTNAAAAGAEQREFLAAGNTLRLKLTDSELVLTESTNKSVFPVKNVQSLNDLNADVVLDLFSNRCVWIESEGEYCRIDSDITAWSEESVEAKLTQSVFDIARQANLFFDRNHTYPGTKGNWDQQPQFAYINPIFGRAVRPTYQTYSQYTDLALIVNGAASADDVTARICQGNGWIEEPPSEAGAIHVLVRSSGTKKWGDAWVFDQMFLRVFGTDGKPLSSGPAASFLALALQDGGESQASEQVRRRQIETMKSRLTGKLFVLNPNLGWIKWIHWSVTLLLGLMLVIELIVWICLDARTRMNKLWGAKVTLSEIAFLVTFAATIAWLISRWL